VSFSSNYMAYFHQSIVYYHSEEDFRSIMKSVQEETGLKGKNLWMPVRIALTGQNHGPELQKLAEYFGKDEVLSRFNVALGIE